jgi:hypothetical protein
MNNTLGDVMGDTFECPTRDFKNAAAAARTVAVNIPADIAESYQTIYGGDWQAQVIGDLTFFVESQKQRQAQVGHLFPLPEPGEDVPLPALT